MTTSVDEVCNDVLRNPKPLVFIDTCTILDVINSLHLSAIAEKYIQQAVALINLHGSNSVHLVTAQNVQEEYNDNIEAVASTAEKQVSLIARHVRVMQSLQNSVTGTSITPPNLSSFNLPKHAKNVAEKLLDSCLIIKRKQDYSARVMDRVRVNRAPARQGGGEAKDCEIIECFFDLAKQLKDNHFDKPIIFVTANTNDYGKSQRLNPPLDSEFKTVNAEYANHLNHALHLCGFSNGEQA